MFGRLAVLLFGFGLASSGHGALPVFDAHLHYNADDGQPIPPARVIAVLDANDVTGALVTSMPPPRAMTLHRYAPERVVPLLGIYEQPADKTSWHSDPELVARLRERLDDGPWRGIGELHLFAQHRHSPVFKEVVELAVRRGLVLQVHSDPAVIDTLFGMEPRATVIWAHAGAYPCPKLLADYLSRYPGLYVDLSVRNGQIAPQGVLDAQWAALLMEYDRRFLVGVDTYSRQRWDQFGRITGRTRAWLSELPEEVAANIARGNARRLFHTSGSGVAGVQ